MRFARHTRSRLYQRASDMKYGQNMDKRRLERGDNRLNDTICRIPAIKSRPLAREITRRLKRARERCSKPVNASVRGLIEGVTACHPM